MPAVGVGKVSLDAQSCDSYCPSAHIKLCLTRLAPPPLGQAPPSTLATPPFCGIIYALQWHLLMTLSTTSASLPRRSQRHTLPRPITTIKQTHKQQQQQQLQSTGLYCCHFSLWLYAFWHRLCAEQVKAEANKSIYFNYNYRLHCSLDLHSADSLPYCAVLLPCGLLQSPAPSQSRVAKCSLLLQRYTPLLGGLLRRIFFGQLLKNEMVLHIVIWLVSGGILHHVSSSYLLPNSSRAAAAWGRERFSLISVAKAKAKAGQVSVIYFMRYFTTLFDLPQGAASAAHLQIICITHTLSPAACALGKLTYKSCHRQREREREEACPASWCCCCDKSSNYRMIIG